MLIVDALCQHIADTHSSLAFRVQFEQLFTIHCENDFSMLSGLGGNCKIFVVVFFQFIHIL